MSVTHGPDEAARAPCLLDRMRAVVRARHFSARAETGDPMVILRPTRKLRTRLPVSSDPEPQSDTVLGDWYVNHVVIYRRPLLLLVSSAFLLAVLIPARDVRILPNRLAEIIAQRLARLGVARKPVDAELEAMTQLHVAPPSDRSVLGIMVDYAKMLPAFLEPGFSDHSGLMGAEELLWDND